MAESQRRRWDNRTIVKRLVSNPAYPDTSEQHPLVWSAAASIPHQGLASTVYNYTSETRNSFGILYHCSVEAKTTMHKKGKAKSTKSQEQGIK